MNNERPTELPSEIAGRKTKRPIASEVKTLEAKEIPTIRE